MTKTVWYIFNRSSVTALRCHRISCRFYRNSTTISCKWAFLSSGCECAVDVFHCEHTPSCGAWEQCILINSFKMSILGEQNVDEWSCGSLPYINSKLFLPKDFLRLTVLHTDSHQTHTLLAHPVVFILGNSPLSLLNCIICMCRSCWQRRIIWLLIADWLYGKGKSEVFGFHHLD